MVLNTIHIKNLRKLREKLSGMILVEYDSALDYAVSTLETANTIMRAPETKE